ncbi:hypothetical protein D9Q98_001766 [Chlorella vulgaris]|uniref:ATP-dependent DNA helicase n=1 Tax=Chlorella vulgaris TaxID=3077 RepID=A0A9D4TV57_CHLVU|nr:hypothetical protein D9Q98_001766 [Chlorella vulgaris]
MAGGLQFSSTVLGRRKDEDWTDQAHAALKANFGFDAFRGRQLEAIQAALNGKDSFVLMPTGGGKSLCYALLPAIRAGLVLVVSPLIALMQDQVESLRARGLRADFLSSTRSEGERRRLLDDMQQRKPDTQLLFVTPELLSTEGFMRCLRCAYAAGALLLVAVDEAHCVSSMGHDFRPSYRQLGAVRQELPRVPLMALTATASGPVERDVCSQLRLRTPVMLRSSFNRPNISYQVRYADLLTDREGQRLQSPLLDLIGLLSANPTLPGNHPGTQQHTHDQSFSQQHQVPCAVIYCHRREDCTAVAAALTAHGVPAEAYHAGLPAATRSRVLQDWQARRLQVVAATVAFGMGIDRADVRLVVHYSLPSSLEAFYQEAGRAGRDGNPSRSVVYYSRRDRQRREFIIGKEQQQQQQRRRVDGGSPPRQRDPLRDFGQVVQYCLSARCRRAAVLTHFGETASPRPPGVRAAATCCDVCSDAAAVAGQLLELAGSEGGHQRAGAHKHGLNFKRAGGRGGAGGGEAGGSEFAGSWAPEGLDFEHEGPSSALDESQEVDAIEDDEEGEGGAAAFAMQRALHTAGGNQARLLAAMERAEAAHQRQQQPTKKARLQQKLESGSAGSAPRTSEVTPAMQAAAVHQAAAALSGNPALVVLLGSGESCGAALAAALVQPLAGGHPPASKPVFQSKLSNLVLRLKKARQADEVPGLSAALAALASPPPMAGTAPSPPAASGAALSPSSLQHQVAEAVRLAEAATPAAASSTTTEASVAAVHAAATAFRCLEAAPVTAALLQQTGAGRKMHQLRKHSVPALATAAAAVEQAWKARLLAGMPP